MKKIISVAAFATMALFCAQGVAAQEYSMDFENNSEWWIKPTFREYISLSNSQAASGTKSMKIDIPSLDKVGDVQNIIAMGVGKGAKLMTLEAGDYTIKLKVNLSETAPVGFNTNIKNSDGKYKVITWKTKGIERGKWVEMTQDITLDAITNGSLNVGVSSNPKWGGVGVIYIDDIQFTKR